ncbi:MAG: hypothetical protein ACSLFR_16005 [Solirubrobacteraceae bacterium]
MTVQPRVIPIALPAFGTGVGGFPVDRAAELIMGAIGRHLADGSDSATSS